MDDDNPTVREDLGYRGESMQDGERYKMNKARMTADKTRIRYISGISKGNEVMISTPIANDLIKRGYAEAIDREPGQEG